MTIRSFHARSAVGALLVCVAACSRGGSSNPANPANPADSANGAVANADPPTRAARLSSVDGDVSLQTPGSDSWSAPTPNYTVSTGDRLATRGSGRAELDLGNAAMRLDDSADVTVTNLTDHFTQLGVDQGDFDASLYQYDPSDSVEIDTPNGALMPTAAGTYLVSVDPNGNATTVRVESGSLDLTGPDLNQSLTAGQVVRLVGTNPIQVVAVTSPSPSTNFADLDRWNTERDPLWRASGTTTRYVSRTVPGWEDLDSDGSWTVDQANTEVWCPSHVESTFVPYRAGHWSWVEPWGWTWVDDARWGYATTHYGRWEQITTSSCAHANNWAWVPGPVAEQPVYAPALVDFVDGATLSLSAGPPAEAWFPLGPREAYFPPYHYSDNYLRQINATNLREVQDVGPLIRARDVDNIRWQNRDNALTVIPAAAFRTGEAVGPHVIRVRPTEIAAARIAPHPSVNPDERLMMGGRPAPRPPIAERPEMVVTRAAPERREPAARARVASAPPAGVPAQPTPLVRRNAPPNQARLPNQANEPGQANQPIQRRELTQVAPPIRSAPGEVGRPIRGGRPPVAVPNAPPANPARPTPEPNPRGGAMPNTPRPIITRNAPPAPRPPVSARMPAMQAHPGRPLEPQQIQNMRGGRPAGPPRDVEVPSHVAPPRAPVVQPRAPQPQAEPPRSPPSRGAPPAPARATPAPPPQRPATAPPNQGGGRGRGRGGDGGGDE